MEMIESRGSGRSKMICEVCKANLDYGHMEGCTIETDAEKIARLERLVSIYKEKCQSYHNGWVRIRQLATMWQGKYEILRRENNALRRKVGGRVK